jgi:hypothetical protein
MPPSPKPFFFFFGLQVSALEGVAGAAAKVTSDAAGSCVVATASELTCCADREGAETKTKQEKSVRHPRSIFDI